MLFLHNNDETPPSCSISTPIHFNYNSILIKCFTIYCTYQSIIIFPTFQKWLGDHECIIIYWKCAVWRSFKGNVVSWSITPCYFMLAIFLTVFFFFFLTKVYLNCNTCFSKPPSITTVWVKYSFMVSCLFLCILTRHPSISGAFALSNAWPGGAVGLQSHHTRDCVGGCYSIRSTYEITQQSTCEHSSPT